MQNPALRLTVAILCTSFAFHLPLVRAADIPKPGDNFFGFANSDWVAGAALPPGFTAWGVRTQRREDNLKAMAKLYHDAANGVPGTTAAAKRVGDFYVSQLNAEAIEAKGATPLQPLLARIAAIDSTKSLSHYLGSTLRIDVSPVNGGAFESRNLFGLWVGPGLQDPKRNMAYLLQGGLGLPQREMYLGADTQPLVEAYRQYIVSSLEKAGIADAQAKAGKIVEFETRIAAIDVPKKTSQDLAQAGQVWRRADFATKARGMNWDAYFSGAGMPRQQSFGAWQPDAIKGLSALVASTPLDTWKSYLAFHAINLNARYLSKPFADAFFAFFDPLILGPGQSRSQWERALVQTNVFMPGVGQLFVENHVSPKARSKAREIVDNIVAVFDRRLEHLAWMTPATRKHARAKLKNMVISIGGPDQWIDSTGLDIHPDDAFGNKQRTSLFAYRHEVAKIGRPVDRREWVPNGELFGINLMPSHNSLTIPATELQSPFFDPDGSDADNYAAIGTSIARFLAQAFDDKGGRFDAQGRQRSWWSPADRQQFDQAATPLLTQFSGYAPFPDLKLNGQVSLNDNVADQAGLLAAYDAFQMARAAKRDQESDQLAARRFFTAYAKSMRIKSSDQALRVQAVRGPQAPAMYRVASVRNLDAWYASFDVMPGQELYLAPAERVRVW